MRVKCHCGKPAKHEFIVYHKGYATTLKTCNEHEPKENYNLKNMFKL